MQESAYRKCEENNVLEMLSVLATENVPEILPYAVPNNIKKMSKFLVYCRKCSYHEQEM